MVRIAIIDPVGIKAGLDHYDVALAKAFLGNSTPVKVYSNFKSISAPVVNLFTFSFYSNYFKAAKLPVDYLRAFMNAKKHGAEIIILHIFHFHFADVAVIRIARLFGFRICLIVHDLENLGTDRRSYIQKCLSSSDYIVVHNRQTADLLNQTAIVENKNKVHVIPHGNFLDLPPKEDRNLALAHFNLAQSKNYILFFGMIKKSKGLDVLIDAMKNVRYNVELIIAGRERNVSFSNYQQMIVNAGIEKRVHSFIRYISNTERNLLMSLSDAVILPYRKIFQSGVLLVAMSSGVPVIASCLPGITDVIDGENGILFRDGDSNDLADKINQLTGNDQIKKSVSENALKTMAGRHDWNNIAKSYLNMFKHT